MAIVGGTPSSSLRPAEPPDTAPAASVPPTPFDPLLGSTRSLRAQLEIVAAHAYQNTIATPLVRDGAPQRRQNERVVAAVRKAVEARVVRIITVNEVAGSEA
jgi:hypothetical protein